MKKQRILKFINAFKSINTKEIEESFLYGNCYWFAFILKEAFGGELYYDCIMNHFVCKIDEYFYDIRGEYKDISPLVSWEEYKLEDDIHTKRIIRDCVFKGVEE